MFYSQPTGLKPSGNESVNPFSKVSIKGNLDVMLYRGDKEEIEIPRNLSGRITIENIGDAVFIDAGKNTGTEGTPVVVRYKQLSGLAVNGKGDVVCEGEINTPAFDLVCKGSGGWVRLKNIQIGHINIAITGNKNLEIVGSARSKNFNIQGSGLHLFRLSTPSSQ